MHRWGSILSIFVFFSLASLFTAIFFITAHTDQPASVEDPDAVHWKNGELVAPLPADPAKRAEAIRMAKEAGARARAEDALVPAEGVRTIRMSAGRPVSVPMKPGWTGDPRRKSGASFVPQTAGVPDKPFRASEEQRRIDSDRLGEIDDPSQISTSYDGMGYFDAIDDTGWPAASPSIAVGTKDILLATSDVFAVYDRCGNFKYGGVFDEYFGLPSEFQYTDPKVIYDDWQGRFIMVYTGNDFAADISRVILCVSQSHDLSDGFYFYDLYEPNPGKYVDNLYIGVDPEGLYIAFGTTSFISHTYATEMILPIPLEDIYIGAPFSMATFSVLHNPDDASLVLGLRPARMRSYLGAMYFMDSHPYGGDTCIMWTLTGGPASPSLSANSIPSPAYATPPRMRQPDGSYVWSSNRNQITDLVYSQGELQAIFTSLYISGEDYCQLLLLKFDVNPPSYSDGFGLHAAGSHYAYGSIDVDDLGRTCILCSHCAYSGSAYLSLVFYVLDWDGYLLANGGTCAEGLANYTAGGDGTLSAPYWWGNYTGCQVDPLDHRTFWMYGAYAGDDPTPSWMTRVANATGYVSSALVVTPNHYNTGGYPGGPFSQENMIFTLENTGYTNVNWRLGNIPYWLTPSDTNGIIPPFGSQNVMLSCNSQTALLSPGYHPASLEFDNCTGTGSTNRSINLYIEDEITCNGSLIELGPETAAYQPVEPTHNDSVSVFLTPLKDIDVCAIGIESNTYDPQSIAMRVYESDGFVRQSKLAEVWYPTVQSIQLAKILPVNLTFEACHDYEIEFTTNVGMSHYYYNEADFRYPFDVGGAIRVTEGGSGGDYNGTELPLIAVYGYSPSNPVTTHETNLFPESATGVTFEEEGAHGLYITPLENMELCSIDFEADLPRDSHLQAWLWEATGTTRNGYITEGHAYADTTGITRHTIPLHALLEYGQDYNIEVRFWDGAYYTHADEPAVTVPFTTSDGAVEVRKGAAAGAESIVLPHLWFHWDPFVSSGVPFDLAKTADGVPPPYSSTENLDHGAFVTTQASQHVFGLGVRADLPVGSILFARVYSVLKGGRNLLRSEGWIYTSKEGMQWHDVPIAFESEEGRMYDLSFVCSTVNEFPYWDDTAGLPYTSYGLYDVVDAEIGGSRSGTELVHMRIHACDDQMTPVNGGVTPHFTPLALEPPVPNPAGGMVSFFFTMDKPCTADMAIYDVLGRRVAQVFSKRRFEAGPASTRFDASKLASGIYFLKLTTPASGVSRKMVVVH